MKRHIGNSVYLRLLLDTDEILSRRSLPNRSPHLRRTWNVLGTASDTENDSGLVLASLIHKSGAKGIKQFNTQTCIKEYADDTTLFVGAHSDWVNIKYRGGGHARDDTHQYQQAAFT